MCRMVGSSGTPAPANGPVDVPASPRSWGPSRRRSRRQAHPAPRPARAPACRTQRRARPQPRSHVPPPPGRASPAGASRATSRAGQRGRRARRSSESPARAQRISHRGTPYGWAGSSCGPGQGDAVAVETTAVVLLSPPVPNNHDGLPALLAKRRPAPCGTPRTRTRVPSPRPTLRPTSRPTGPCPTSTGRPCRERREDHPGRVVEQGDRKALLALGGR